VLLGDRRAAAAGHRVDHLDRRQRHRGERGQHRTVHLEPTGQRAEIGQRRRDEDVGAVREDRGELVGGAAGKPAHERGAHGRPACRTVCRRSNTAGR
jgi:hypothetical protein